MENNEEKSTKYDFVHKDVLVKVPVSSPFIGVLYSMINYFASKMGKEEFLKYAKIMIDGAANAGKTEPPQTEYQMYVATLSSFIMLFEVSAKEQNLTYEIDSKDFEGLSEEEKGELLTDLAKKAGKIT